MLISFYIYHEKKMLIADLHVGLISLVLGYLVSQRIAKMESTSLSKKKCLKTSEIVCLYI
jgi:hypothetical protein